MFNKRGIIILTIIISVLCLYNLMFTWVSRNIQEEATEIATDKNGEVNAKRKQDYLDSIFEKPVFNFLGMEYTYKEIKENELSLGLDLQGGMHVILEVSQPEVLKTLAGSNSTDPKFLLALERANKMKETSTENFSDLFFKAYSEVNAGAKLSAIFTNQITKEKGIDATSSDEDIKKMINQQIAKSVDIAENIIRTRIDKFGVIQPNIQRLAGTGRIQLELPGVDNPQRVRNLLKGVAQLEFLEVYFMKDIGANYERINTYLLSIEKPKKKTDTTAAKTPVADNKTAADSTLAKADSSKNDTAAKAKATAKKDTAKVVQSSFFNLQKDPRVYGPLVFDIKDTAQINKIINMPKVKALLPAQCRLLWKKPSPHAKKKNKGKDLGSPIQLIAVKKERPGKVLTGEVIEKASADTDPKQGVVVSMSMNDAGTKKWREMTKKASSESDYNGEPRRIAIVLDDVVYSDPTVKNEISDGHSQISGNFTMEEAKDLATILESGSLPAPLIIESEVTVGPTLGKEAISNGLISMLAGMVVVILFMVAYYSRGGWVADIALLFNLLFIVGIMANLNAVLTLPGIAGILLSIAIAVDANVLINERVKEELNEGKSIDSAINSGYKNASSAIIDSNITTLIKGFVLLSFGTGLILGFAVTLIIGIFCSLFTSVLITRVIFNMRKKQNISFSNNWSKNLFKKININFIGNRRIYYIISSLVIVAGIVSISLKGFNLGVDFKGGRNYIVQYEKPVTTDEIKKNLTQVLGTSPEVKTYGSNDKFKITTSYLVENNSETATAKAEAKMTEGLSKVQGNKVKILSSSKVGPTIADDTKGSAITSLLVAIALMFLYILIRFRKIEFAFGTVVSLFHTVLVVLAVFSLLDGIVPFSLEIDQTFIAAILTVIGYSINDSVVVFDRIREFLAIHKGDKNTANVINNALNDTLSRTLITGMSTIFVIIILFVFGGESIKAFSFAMLFGVLVGTYSSLCIGSPVLVDFGKWISKKDNSKTAVNA